MSTNQGRLDGLVVEMYDGRFAGAFEMDSDIGESIAYDDVVTFMVVAVAGKASFDTNKSGDLKRTNTFEVTNVSIVPNDMAVKIANQLDVLVDGLNAGQLTFDQPSTVDEEYDTLVDWIEEEGLDDTEPQVVASIPKSTNDKDLNSFLYSNTEEF